MTPELLPLGAATVATLALRRWPALAYTVGVAVALALAGTTADWTARGLVVPVVLLTAIVTRWRPGWPWGVAASVLAVGPLATRAWALDRKLGWMLAVGAVLGGVLAAVRRPDRSGTTAVLLVAGLCGVVLIALTGSVRLSAESLRGVVPLLALAGLRLDARTASAVALVLAFGWMQGVLWSYLSHWVLVPVATVAVVWIPDARLGARPALARTTIAIAIAALGSASVVVDWIQDPPF